MKNITTVIRVLVGLLFIISGAVKLIDPIGTAIKLEEYFEVFATDIAPFFSVFQAFATPMSVVFCMLEVVLGVALLVGFKPKLTIGLLSIIIVFFTFLTFYSAWFNKVTDCGCFGDFIKLTPWTSFSKDVFLTILIGVMVFNTKYLTTRFTNSLANTITVLATAVCGFVAWWALYHLPLIDFRPYKVGANIPALMKLPPNAKPDVVKMKMHNSKSNEDKLVTADEYANTPALWQDTTWHVISSDVVKGDRPVISDFNVINDAEGDITQKVFQGNKFIIIVLDAAKADRRDFIAIAATVDNLRRLENPKVECLILTSSLENEIDQLRHDTQLSVPYYFTDATVLKTIMRSNPGTWLLKNGTVMGKYHYHDTPRADQIVETLQSKK